MKKNEAVLIAFFSLCAQILFAQTNNLDSLILLRMQQTNTPGVSALILKKGIPVWEKNYGLSRIATNKPVTDSTIFMLASVSKTIVAVAAMQAWEQNLFNLDDDINRYLPFHVANPNNPDDTVTMRQLLTHTSSVRDNPTVEDSIYVNGDATMPLGIFLQNYFVRGGQFYDSSKNFYSYEPGKKFNFSDFGTDLAAYVVESVTHISFDTFCMQNIFGPLCMDNTSWHLAGLDTTLIAKPYTFADSAYSAIQFYGFPDYPRGELRTTARSLARFLAMIINDGFFNEQRILKVTSITKMFTPQFPGLNPAQGILWYQLQFGNFTCWGHSGNDRGASTNMFFYAPDTSGIILLSNSNSFYPDDVIADMFTLAKSLEPAEDQNFNCDGTPAAIPPVQEFNKTVFPNPAHSFITIQQNGNSPVKRISIFSAEGKKILSEELQPNENKISVAQLANGIYFMKLIFLNQVQTIPFIKN